VVVVVVVVGVVVVVVVVVTSQGSVSHFLLVSGENLPDQAF
jgi:hypothetical protein